MLRMPFAPLARPQSTIVAILVVGMLLLPLSSTSLAEPAARSLTLVPQDASFYSAMLRNREQFDALVNSNFWKQLNEWEIFQEVRGEIMKNLQRSGADWQQILQLLAQPENQQALEVLKDMVSREMFCYGDSQMVDTLALAIEITNSARFSPLFYQMSGRESGLSQDEFTQKIVLDLLADNLDDVAVPGLVFGFKIDNVEAANQQLQRLEASVREMLEKNPELAPFKDEFRREKIGDSEFLTLTVKGDMAPWEELPFEDLEDEEGQYDDLRAALKEATIVLSLGIRGDYVILALGKSTEALASLGQGDVLADHERLAPLTAAGNNRYTSIGYVSEELRDALATKPEDLDNIVDLAEELLPQAEDLSDETREQILEDVGQLVEDMRPYIPHRGAQLTFCYLTDRGIESKRYDWSENTALDGSKPLSLLNHLGGTPVLAVLARTQHRPGDYELLAKWLSKARDYFDELVVPQMPNRQRDGYEEFAEIAYPLLSQVHEINRTMLIPALADGQGGLVIDGDEKSKTWTQFLPPTEEELAVPAPALVFGVSDAALFDQALSGYRHVINRAIAELHKANPQQVPDFELPPAKLRKLEDGTKIYYYRLPEQLGVHSRVAPNIAVSEKYAVLSLIPRQTKKLATAKPLAVESGPLAEVDRPLAAATYFDWNALVDMLAPWAKEMARADVRRQFGEQSDDMEDAHLTKMLDAINKGAELLKVFQGYTSVTYLENGAVVTHSETGFEDLE